MTQFIDVRHDKILHEIMPVLVGLGKDGNIYCFGSCFFIAPYIALTAKHVTEELTKQDPGLIKGMPNKDYWLVQTRRIEDEFQYVVWALSHVSMSYHSDIAVIWVQPYDENAAKYNAWKGMPITFDAPKVGSTVTGFGFHNFRSDGSRMGTDGKWEHISVDCDRSRSTGKVLTHYHDGRDRIMYPFPCFEVNCRFDLGMSGGLVINEQSQVCGIVCGSLPPDEGGTQHTSYVTLLWPMLAVPVDHTLIPGSTENRRYVLRDLLSVNGFLPIGHERVAFDIDQSSTAMPKVYFTRPA